MGNSHYYYWWKMYQPTLRTNNLSRATTRVGRLPSSWLSFGDASEIPGTGIPCTGIKRTEILHRSGRNKKPQTRQTPSKHFKSPTILSVIKWSNKMLKFSNLREYIHSNYIKRKN